MEGALVGSLVLNRFLIERRIGSGGFGVVYEAWDGRLERPVAVKAIEQRGEAGRRVLREAQAAARLNHPGIAAIHDVFDDGRRCYIVMEYVEGRSLYTLADSRLWAARADGRMKRPPPALDTRASASRGT